MNTNDLIFIFLGFAISIAAVVFLVSVEYDRAKRDVNSKLN